MKSDNIKSGLQDLIYRLQDAEKGYLEIAKISSNAMVSTWLKKYAQERHNMHGELEMMVLELGEKPEVETTFLGKLHRMFIDFKINMVSKENELEAIITEIERGASFLIKDYTNVLTNIDMPADMVAKLMEHKMIIQRELTSLLELKESLTKTA